MNNRSEQKQIEAGTLDRNKRLVAAYPILPMKELVRLFGISRQRISKIVNAARLRKQRG